MRGLSVLGLLLLVALPAAAENDRLIVPGERAGPITARSTQAELVAAFGPANLREQPFHIGEGETAPGYAIFPDTPWQFHVRLIDDGGRIDVVRFVGTGGPWHTASGLRLGLTLAEVERINGGPFVVTGTGWDYSGVVAGWEAGAIPDTLRIRFNASRRAAPEVEAEAAGDAFRSSGDGALRAIGYRVYMIEVELR